MARIDVTVDALGTEIVSQVVDNDGDGQMDELIFQGDFSAGESKRYSIEARAPQSPPEPILRSTLQAITRTVRLLNSLACL